MFAGMISGYYSGVIDILLMRLVDIVVAFPFFVLVISIIAILGPGIRNMYVAITMVGWIAYAKIMRGEILVAKNYEYVLAAKALGYSNPRIMWHHLLPNAIGPCIVFAMTDIVLCILSAAGLGYLGLGVQAPTPEWGAMIADGREFVATAWWISTIPGLAIAVVGIGFSLLGDGLVDLLRKQTQ
jgi:peptide/nickel transport system permease protein